MTEMLGKQESKNKCLLQVTRKYLTNPLKSFEIGTERTAAELMVRKVTEGVLMLLLLLESVAVTRLFQFHNYYFWVTLVPRKYLHKQENRKV